MPQTTQTQSLQLTDGPITFAGAISLDTSDKGVQPWRLVHDDLLLYEPALRDGPARHAAGVRLTLVSDTASLTIAIAADEIEDAPVFDFDLFVDGKFHERFSLNQRPGNAVFANLPQGEHTLEVYLPQKAGVRVQGVSIDANASAKRFDDPRPRWLVYGSSITQCGASLGPSETWPALVASKFDLNLTCLGYGGNCHMEPVVTRMLRDQPADYISLCLGVNMFGGSSYSYRTFRAGVLGTILTIRDKHPDTPLIVVSPISNPPREEKPNLVDMTLPKMRETIHEVVTLLQQRGDKQLHVINGLDVFGPDLAHHMPDGLHPDANGYHVLAEQYAKVVMPVFGLKPKR